jgi:hypothetical protein
MMRFDSAFTALRETSVSSVRLLCEELYEELGAAAAAITAWGVAPSRATDALTSCTAGAWALHTDNFVAALHIDICKTSTCLLSQDELSFLLLFRFPDQHGDRLNWQTLF